MPFNSLLVKFNKFYKLATAFVTAAKNIIE